ncbi:MAG: Aerobic respiration control sensor protein ArcB [Pelotomaculum sp. PtaB.Bin013]|uniref:histidine kinase n=1 Tax=Pelotomaculum isophthalicicum JI TaxID=947010 RepID=A0A9X4H433_9FIRM|nr:ATP-binding protein [Pelotomaculum isophthalicicum]MDF9408433.1 ATP-binding protein [Pelotomaculum isophthalicicum JI]OPX91689.1 MAG: Aerobic respiration control sensor protein ArcB [Pelotomaculum sp. PtaB.Bin013]
MRELSHHLLDIIENSLAAGASTVRITVIEDSAGDILSFEVGDNGGGMNEEEIEQIFDPFVTSRRLRRVGLGIPLLQQAARACGGDLIIQSEKGKGTTVKATFQRSHIDRMPLGDVAATLVAAVAANPDVNLLYNHLVDGRQFVFDTSWLIGKFKELPLNDIEVLSWIKEFCRDGIKKLYRGEK